VNGFQAILQAVDLARSGMGDDLFRFFRLFRTRYSIEIATMNYIEQALKAVEKLDSPEEQRNEINEVNEIRVRSLGRSNALSIAAKHSEAFT